MVLQNPKFKQRRAETRWRLCYPRRREDRANAKKIKLSRQPDRPDIERILVGQSAEKLTR
jgi:hypothetical protein